MTANSLDCATLQMVMRPPRVAIIFNGEGNWRYWARLALYASTRLWGGRGFVLVPHKAGEVSPEMLHAVRAYDPDYVVSLEATVGVWEQAQPGVLSIPAPEGGATDQLGGTRRSEFIAANSAEVVPSPQAEQAQRRVAEACTPHLSTTPENWIFRRR